MNVRTSEQPNFNSLDAKAIVEEFCCLGHCILGHCGMARKCLSFSAAMIAAQQSLSLAQQAPYNASAVHAWCLLIVQDLEEHMHAVVSVVEIARGL